MSNEEKIWSFLLDKFGNKFGVAGLMGNLYAESGLQPNNLQNYYEKKLGMTDDEYVAAVDSGAYKNFVKDSAGFGLAQWTFWSRKQNLLNYAISQNKSIGDLEMQLEFLFKELTAYTTVYSTLKSATSILEASNIVLMQYERPANQGAEVQAKRAEYGQRYYDKYANYNGGNIMSNSSLVTYTNISPNKTSPRNHEIDTVSVHCIVGQWTAKQGCDFFSNSARQCSANYVVGKDGSIGLCVDEGDRSWCSSNASNDHRAVTIEVASDMTHPYAVTDAAYNALIELLADICRRNNIKELKWQGDKSLIGQVDKQNMTVHRWFAAKACPGDYLYNKHGEIAAAVNAKLGVGATTSTNTSAPSSSFPAVPFLAQVLIPELNMRKEPTTASASNGFTGKGVFTIVEVQNGWGRLKSGAGWIYLENPEYVKINSPVANATAATSSQFTPYIVSVTADVLNVRAGAGTNYPINCTVRRNEAYTIVAEDGSWGKLKSGAGWISLNYVKRV